MDHTVLPANTACLPFLHKRSPDGATPNSVNRHPKLKKEKHNKQVSKTNSLPVCEPCCDPVETAQLVAARVSRRSAVCVGLTWHCAVTTTHCSGRWNCHLTSLCHCRYCPPGPGCVPPSSVASTPAPPDCDIPAAETTGTSECQVPPQIHITQICRFHIKLKVSKMRLVIPRFNLKTTILQSANKFPRLPSRTKKYHTFISYALAHYQTS